MSMRRNGVLIAASLACVVAAGSMFGCGTTQTATQNTEQAANRAYMSQVNQTMSTLDDKLDAFVDAVTRGDSVGMKTQVDRALESLSSLETIEAPDALKDVQASYKEGANDLKEALKEYVDLYTSTDPASIDAQKLQDIQSKYDAGVNALKDADKKASELPN